jgi:hypothetical protein
MAANRYTSSADNICTGYIDSDYAVSVADKKSTLGYAFHFGKNLISWASKKHPIFSINYAKEEYVVATTTTCHAVCLKMLLLDFGYTTKEPILIFCDNNSTISLSKNNVFHHKRKNIDTQFHFIHELVKNGDISLKFCGSKAKLVDIFTKPLGKDVFQFQRQSLGIINNLILEIKREC